MTAARMEWLDRFAKKVGRQVTKSPHSFPHVTEGGRWGTTPDGNWTGGFWVGQLWWLWKLTGDPAWRQAAEGCLTRLAPRKDALQVDFDLGFLFHYSSALGYDLTGEPTYRDVALGAADRLLTLVHPVNGLIYHVYPERVARHGPTTGSSIVDVMMNLSLLWWAHEQTSEKRYYDAAVGHSRQTAQWFVRPDGSTVQVVDFDVETGAFLRHDTHQGHVPGSCWSRGQAWAIYGFWLSWQHTGESLFRQMHDRLLAYWADNVSEDGVPPWDFDAPSESKDVRDTSAAAIACAALARAGRHTEWRSALHQSMLASLTGPYLAPDEVDGVLSGGCWHYPAGWGVNEATVWGDYFLLEVLSRGVKPVRCRKGLQARLPSL